VALAPRSLLKRQAAVAAAQGYDAAAASELEYYIFRDSYRDAARKGYRDLEPAGWYVEDYHALQGGREEELNAAARRHLRASGIPVESSKGEWGLGQHELNIRYADVTTMADRHTLYKQCLKEVAERLGWSVSFMAKFSSRQAGSSCHVHLSLWKGGKNAFAGDAELGPVRCSPEFRWFLGGWLRHLRELMVFYAPNVNSYKRYRAGSWAPTGIAWSRDNRTAGFRVVGEAQSLRIECRVPGADCNPYLVYAAALASGIEGIERRIEPPAAFEGDVYNARDVPKVPGTLREAVDAFAASALARKAFGEEVVEHYTRFFNAEDEAFRTAVTDWERRRYFERI
jgi:glutamine synthetase